MVKNCDYHKECIEEHTVRMVGLSMTNKFSAENPIASPVNLPRNIDI